MTISLICVTLVGATPVAAERPPEVETLVSWMTGSFGSTEQAVAGMADKPYRQRSYRITAIEEGLFRSAVYALPDPESRVGAWRDDEPLSDLSPDDLDLRAGCAVFFRWDDSGEYVGGTIGRGCASSLRGASYATSEVIVGEGRIESWDHGFDSDHAQVWGAEKGPYIFCIRHERETTEK